MSRLEGLAAPILTPVVEGRPQVIEPIAQLAIGTWAYKTALCFDKASIGKANVAPWDYSSLGVQRIPPQHCQVWIGNYEWEADGIAANFLSRLDAVHPTTSGEAMDFGLWKITLTVGHALFSIIGPTVSGRMFDVDWGEFAGMMDRLWPLSFAIEWPRGRSFDRSQFEAMAVVPDENRSGTRPRPY